MSTEESPILAVTETTTFLEDNVRKMSFTVLRDLPEGHTFLSQGVLYTADPQTATEEAMIKGGKAQEQITDASGGQGEYRLVVNNVLPQTQYYCRAYILYQDENGLEKVRYSNIASNIFMDEQPVITMAGTKIFEEDGIRKMSFTSSRSVPDDCQLLELGFLYTTDGTQSKEETMVLKNVKLSKYQGTFTSPEGIYTLTLRNARPGVRCYCRAYLIYQDRDGNQQIAYSSVGQNVYLNK